ncbi:MAG TPA: heavy-metal-associated domain-containing protein [Bacteroidia bacterium]|nr:heavy-metal-associated domain-containing protein [Bacteroidia bacterium]
METLKFKTNIKCGGCIEKVTPFLKELTSVLKWEVNTSVADKILTIESSDSDSKKIIEALAKAGYQAELIS